MDPLQQFLEWYSAAEEAGLRAPNAMALATASADGAPSVRMVLLKAAEEDGFAFFTGYLSRKAGELEANPRAALLFYWDALGRQVRVEGAIGRLSADESDAYFATRPRGAQLAASASRQSAVLRSRDELEARIAELDQQFAEREVPRPQHWGGYKLTPEVYEFWQHRDDRAHERLRYRRDGDAWVAEQLWP
jgi:pyridoxamine 5'-phosphate oxidase